MSRARASGVGEGTAGPQDDSSMQREDEDSCLLLQVTRPPHLHTFICLIIRWATNGLTFLLSFNIFLSRCVSVFCHFPPLHHPSGPFFHVLHFVPSKNRLRQFTNPPLRRQNRYADVVSLWSGLFDFPPFFFCFSVNLTIASSQPLAAARRRHY